MLSNVIHQTPRNTIYRSWAAERGGSGALAPLYFEICYFASNYVVEVFSLGFGVGEMKFINSLAHLKKILPTPMLQVMKSSNPSAWRTHAFMNNVSGGKVWPIVCSTYVSNCVVLIAFHKLFQTSIPRAIADQLAVTTRSNVDATDNIKCSDCFYSSRGYNLCNTWLDTFVLNSKTLKVFVMSMNQRKNGSRYI